MGRRAGSGCARWPGWASGQSARRSAGGLITAQLANDMVRDHRNSPLLLLRLNEPCTAANQLMYPTTGSTPASSEAPARRHPALLISRKRGTSRTSGRVVGRMVTDVPIIRPAAITRRSDGA